MEQKKYTEAGTDIDEVKKLNAASGLSYNDVKALLAQKVVEEIPLKPIQENLEVDSGTYKIHEVPGSINLNQNGPN